MAARAYNMKIITTEVGLFTRLGTTRPSLYHLYLPT